MADEHKPVDSHTQTPAEGPPALPPAQTESPDPPPTDRAELLQRARAFLTSPQVGHEDVSAKRRFLAEKGLTDTEIDSLLYEVVRSRQYSCFLYPIMTLVLSHHLLLRFRLGHTLNRPHPEYHTCS